jgi:hypothetical protein
VRPSNSNNANDDTHENEENMPSPTSNDTTAVASHAPTWTAVVSAPTAPMVTIPLVDATEDEEDDDPPNLRTMASISPMSKYTHLESDKYQVPPPPPTNDDHHPLQETSSTDSFFMGGPLWRQAEEQVRHTQQGLDTEQDSWVRQPLTTVQGTVPARSVQQHSTKTQPDALEHSLTTPRRRGVATGLAELVSSRAEPLATPPVHKGRLNCFYYY